MKGALLLLLSVFFIIFLCHFFLFTCAFLSPWIKVVERLSREKAEKWLDRDKHA